MKKKLLIFTMAIIMMLGASVAIIFAADSNGEPSLAISKFSLSLEEAVYMNFKVKSQNIKNTGDIKLLAWNGAPEAYTKGTEDLCLSSRGTEEGTGYELFQYNDLAAKDMTKMVYVCAYANIDGTEVYSAPSKLSVLMYAYLKKNAASPDEKLVALMDSMLSYGGNAQLYFDYNTDFLASDPVCQIKTVSGLFDDDFNLGWYKQGGTATVVANAPAEGFVFSHWENSAGEVVATTATAEVPVPTATLETYTAVYSGSLEYTLSDDESYYIVSGIGSCTDTDIVIPSEYKSLSVKQIASGAFSGNTTIQSVVVPSSITYIGEGAFSGCTSLRRAELHCYELSNSCVSGSIFSGCSSLEYLYLKDLEYVTTTSYGYKNYYPVLGKLFGTSYYTGSVATKMNYYMSERAEMRYITYYLPESLKTICLGGYGTHSYTGGGYADVFYGCDTIKEIIIEDGIGTIPHMIFYGLSGLEKVTIPNSVKNIDSSAFIYCSSLKSITIPNSVTNIEFNAFQGCTGLTSITIPDSVTSIGREAFYNCTGLESVTIGNGVTSIGEYVFEGCTNLTSITIPDSVTNISPYAFSGCTKLIQTENGLRYIDRWVVGCDATVTSVVFRPNTVGIGNSAFYGYTGLTSITIPDSVTSIGSQAFYHCTGLTSITIPDSVTSIGSSAFSGCTGLTSITIPDSVTSIGSSAFSGCTGLTSITIPDSVTSIVSQAFYNCTGLTSITIPDSVTSIGQNAFLGCTNLIQIENGVHYVDRWVIDCDTDVTSVVLRPNTVGIGDYAFSNCTSLTSVTIGNGVTTIGDSAFYGCSKLTGITFGNSIKYIGKNAFYNCSWLTTVYISDIGAWCKIEYYDNYSNPMYYADYLRLNGKPLSGIITIPEGVEKIPYHAFYNCSEITGIVIPSSLKSIGSNPFYGCKGLTDVYISDIGAWCKIKYYDNNSNPMYYADYLHLNGKPLSGIITIPEGVEKIPYHAFYNCSEITSVIIPDSVTSIGYGAFSGCTGLTSITIPDSVTSIGNYAFSGCTGLTSVTIGNSVTSIGNYAFSGCTGLTSVTIGNSVTSIGDSAFYGCSKLTGITFGNSVTSIGNYAFEDCTRLTSITIPGSVTTFGSSAFRDCTSLTSVTIGNGVTTIGSYAFSYCTSLTSITIPDSVTIIGYGAFSGCTGLTSITIPDSVTNIGYYAFSNCTSLTSVAIGNGVTSIGDYAFSGCTKLSTVYYTGTEAEWQNISGSSSLSGVTVVYNYKPN